MRVRRFLWDYRVREIVTERKNREREKLKERATCQIDERFL
jgi:hypothetical protein